MAQYGLGNFLYEITVESDNANFKFWDEHDADNTAEVSVATKDFPEGIKAPDSREVADVAYAKVSEKLNEKRDARLKREADKELADKQAADKQARVDAQEFFDGSKDVAVAPVNEEKDKDGNVTSRVYNTGEGNNQETKKK